MLFVCIMSMFLFGLIKKVTTAQVTLTNGEKFKQNGGDFKQNGEECVDNRPIIGIMAQECISERKYLEKIQMENVYHSYIAASYVKFFESAGARIVPIPIGQSKQYYRDLINNINGVILPGGATYFTEPNGYAESVEKFYWLAKEKNLPIFAICLGFELIVYLEQKHYNYLNSSKEGENYRINCSASDIALNLEFLSGYRESKLFENLPSDVEKILSTENVTANYHKYCVNKKVMEEAGMTEDQWKILATSRDKNQKEFVAVYESINHPIFAVQFHPEKNAYEWIQTKRIPHTYNAIYSAQFFANFFASQVRNYCQMKQDCQNDTQNNSINCLNNSLNCQNHTKNNSLNCLNNGNITSDMLIYNYEKIYTGKLGSNYEECYFFE